MVNCTGFGETSSITAEEKADPELLAARLQPINLSWGRRNRDLVLHSLDPKKDGNYELAKKDGLVFLRSKHLAQPDAPLPPKFKKCSFGELHIDNNMSQYRACIRAPHVLEPFYCFQLFNVGPSPATEITPRRNTGADASMSGGSDDGLASLRSSPLTTPRELTETPTKVASAPLAPEDRVESKFVEAAALPSPKPNAKQTPKPRGEAGAKKTASSTGKPDNTKPATSRSPPKEEEAVDEVKPAPAKNLLSHFKKSFVPPAPMAKSE